MSVNKLIKKILQKRGYSIIKTEHYNAQTKYIAETGHWKKSFSDYQKWYSAKIDLLWGEKPPSEDQRINGFPGAVNAILTWQKIHQQTKYLQDLELDETVFSGLKLLDIGSGPHPSALVFKNCNLFCLDPLLPDYMKIGFPFHFYEDRVKFTYGFSEDMPFTDNFFDAVISVNAIDHVDDFEKTASEIKRVLKPEGKLRLHIHYHPKTITEPLELNDRIVNDTFKWCKDFKKLKETKEKRGTTLLNVEGESYALWSNF